MGLGLGILPRVNRVINSLRNPILYKNQIRLASVIRQKENISVLFVLTSLASWKTENVYRAMSKNKRFTTYILVTEANDEDSRSTIKTYLESKGYSYFELGENENIYSKVVPDIIFYEKPYDKGLANHKLQYNHYNQSLYCYVSYGMHNSLIPADYLENNPLQNVAFQEYFENEDVAKEISKYKSNKGKNHIVTGHPACDSYLCFDKNSAFDSWKKQATNKKRIIYAPHHTIDHEHEKLPYSTFLEFGDFMLEMAEKYKDQVQFAFKPHPVLIWKLYKVWGKEKTDTYYAKWGELENCQIETGTYTNLFMFSDAMIHDCGSFQIEYHYTHNPVMYLTHDEEKHRKGLTHFAQLAFDLHYKGHNKEEIEHFIQSVINGTDSIKKTRLDYFNNYLLPPYGQTATENIIDAILGEGNYK